MIISQPYPTLFFADRVRHANPADPGVEGQRGGLCVAGGPSRRSVHPTLRGALQVSCAGYPLALFHRVPTGGADSCGCLRIVQQ